MSRLIVFPFCERDQHRTVRLLSWLLLMGMRKETYGKGTHLVLAHTRDSNADSVRSLAELAFESVEEFQPDEQCNEGWPVACNFLFIRTATYLAQRGQPFFWMENDAVPLRIDFLDQLWAAYAKLPPGSFMGDTRIIRVPAAPPVDASFMNSGAAVYPDPTGFVDRLVVRGLPWDCQLVHAASGHLFATELIQDAGRICPQFHTLADVKRVIRPSACVFHNVKRGNLVELLTRKHIGQTAPTVDTDDRPNLPPLHHLMAMERNSRGLAGSCVESPYHVPRR